MFCVYLDICIQSKRNTFISLIKKIYIKQSQLFSELYTLYRRGHLVTALANPSRNFTLALHLIKCYERPNDRTFYGDPHALPVLLRTLI